jgi:DNA/RNA-binding domain of Phe-tRNA-synthetase-like protein
MHVIPCGGEDLAHVVPPVHLAFATGEQPFDTMKDGAPSIEHPNPGEVVWADAQGVTCRAWNWRQGVRTRLTEATTDAYFLFDALAPVGEAELHEAASDLEGKLKMLAPHATLERQWVRTGPEHTANA